MCIAVRVYVKSEGDIMNFKEKYLKGLIEFEEIDDYTHKWGMSDDERTLCEYLGLNADEEDAWVSISEEALYNLLEAQKNSIPKE